MLSNRMLLSPRRKNLLISSFRLLSQKNVNNRTKRKTADGGIGKWLMLVFPVSGFALGTWQVKRKQWKLGLIQQLEEKTKSEPIPFPSDVSELGSLEYRPITLRGAFDHSREIYIEPRSLLDNEKSVDAGSVMSMQNKNIGMQVITPFFMPDRGIAVLVNRGFVSRERKDPRTRLGGQVEGEVKVTGILRHTEKRPPLIPKNNPHKGQWNYKDLDEMASLTGTSPILLDAIETVPNGPIGGQTRVTLRDEHVSYAVTWYSLSLVTAVMWYSNRRGKVNAEMSMAKEFFLITPSVKATASVIFLHGLGDNGSGWYHAFDDLKKNDTRYIFPNAPSMPVTLNGGFVMPSWYDLKGLDANVPEDEKGIKSAAEKIRLLINKETEEHGIPSERIILGGFSMGGALALYTALTHPNQLAGVIAMSSWLPLHKHFTKGEGGHSLVNQKCAIIQGHGESDQMVPQQFGKMTHSLLKAGRASLGTETDFKLYPGMGHQSCDAEMDDVKQFIDKCLA